MGAANSYAETSPCRINSRFSSGCLDFCSIDSLTPPPGADFYSRYSPLLQEIIQTIADRTVLDLANPEPPPAPATPDNNCFDAVADHTLSYSAKGLPKLPSLFALAILFVPSTGCAYSQVTL